MKIKHLVFIITALICILPISNLLAMPYDGTISLESKTVNAGSSVSIQLRLTGGEGDLTSLRIPIKFDTRYITCENVDFSGSIKPEDITGIYNITEDGLEIAYLPPVVNPLPTIAAASGLLATIYFTVSADAPELSFTMDSLNETTSFNQFGTSFQRHNRIELTGSDVSETMLPLFVSGLLTVQRPTGIDDDSKNLLPGEFRLNQNYPNPFNPTTSIEFALTEKSRITLEIFNVLGQKVTNLADGEYSAGTYRVDWDASEFPSGVYFYRISANSTTDTKKMLFLK